MKILSEICVIENASIDRMLAQSQEEFLALFSKGEREYCLARKKWTIHLAVRFAAKKAVYTILGAGAEIQWNTVLVRKHASGAPYIRLKGSAAERAHTLNIVRWHLSLTHAQHYSAAFVVAEGRKKNHRLSTFR